ncbi:hypothetical protein HFO56_01405 [Rhizobium laguerreae]|uniref:hypothetical protein n=1 Tax=Rhizobium laguerreae TaxID=1076926 RepID=UPI001C9216A2|nr:hypothetical protein [Rhizobium laguerreae]MBY3151066.1 hypothetical protein [Rhizobium laguerreae]
MQFTIGASTVTIDFPDKNFDAVARAFLADEHVKAAVKDHAASFHFRSWDRDGDVDQSTIDKIVGIALDESVERAVDYMIENDFDIDPSDYFHACEGVESTTKLISGFLAAFVADAAFEEGSAEEESFRETVLQHVIETVEEQMTETDRSTPSDFFKRGDEARIAFVQGYGSQGYLDDIHSEHVDVVCNSETLKPDRNLMLQFKLLNISPVAFVEYYKAERGQDLANPAFGDGVSEHHRRQLIENAQAWRFACDVFNGVDVSEAEIPDWLSYGDRAKKMADVVRSCRDLDRPSAVSLGSLEEILDNATYGGVGTWYGRVSAREIMQGQFDNGFVATGGVIGVYDFGNGSGHLLSLENPVLIDLRDGKLVGDARFSYNPERVYGFTRRALDTETLGTKLSDWVQYKAGIWRSATSSENGHYAEISFVQHGGSDERKLYSITVKNRENQESAIEPLQFYGKLDDAKATAVADFLANVALPAAHASQTDPSGPRM